MKTPIEIPMIVVTAKPLIMPAPAHHRGIMATNILGISAFYHDSAACLVRDGEIVAAATERGADLIVVGRHGASGALRRAVLGSTAQQVVGLAVPFLRPGVQLKHLDLGFAQVHEGFLALGHDPLRREGRRKRRAGFVVQRIEQHRPEIVSVQPSHLGPEPGLGSLDEGEHP